MNLVNIVIYLNFLHFHHPNVISIDKYSNILPI
jgi:hypothetical protein